MDNRHVRIVQLGSTKTPWASSRAASVLMAAIKIKRVNRAASVLLGSTVPQGTRTAPSYAQHVSQAAIKIKRASRHARCV